MDSVEIIKNQLLLEELRRSYDYTCEKFASARNRILTFLALELAVITYFFTDFQSLIPSELYGIVFFAIGAACLLFSAGLFFYCYRSIHNWPSPIGPVEIEKLDHTTNKDEILKIFVNDYKDASNAAERIFSRYAKITNWGLYLFITGAIILLIIKFF